MRFSVKNCTKKTIIFIGINFERKILPNQSNLIMKRCNAVLICFLMLFGALCYAQQGRNEEIVKAVNDYFMLERENIHAHFDKKVFMTNENIWFKGYVFHRKKNVPFFTTINVYASLIDDQGKILDTKLLYGNLGSFTGNFRLGDNFKSGKYYVQFYTNWMNNFSEDESSVYEIAVVNPGKGSGTALAPPDPSSINIDFSPEGGTFVSGVANNIGLQVSDCNHNPLSVTTAEIVDKSGIVIRKVQLNKLGYGRLEMPAGNTEGYKAIVDVNGRKHEKLLPTQELRGIALDVNSFSNADNTVVKIRSNKTTTDYYAGKSLHLIIHQDNKVSVMEFLLSPKNSEQIIAVPNTDIADGLNTLRIVDGNLLQVAERIFFKYPKAGLTSELTSTEKTSEKLGYKGKVSCPNMNISISVLPENSISFDETNDIYGSFLLLPYLDNSKKASGRHYFTTISRGRLYELDLFLLSQKSKYKWFNILQNPPKHNYSFDMGVTLRGSVPGSVDTKSSRIRLYSLTSGIDEMVEVNDKREFVFDHLIIPDSSYVNFTLLRRGQEPKELTLAPQVLNGTKKFNKPYVPQQYKYAAIDDSFNAPNIYQEVTELEGVTITGSGLKYANSYGNGNLRGYKPDEHMANVHQTLVNYLKTYSPFWVNDLNGELRIETRTINSVKGGQTTPAIFLDNVQLMSNTVLTNIQMSEVDEIYMSSTAIVPSVRNFMGMIKIYLKQGVNPRRKGSGTPEIIVKNSFEKITPFENVTYNIVDDKGFTNFGVIDWKPNIMTDENGEFSFSIPRMSAKPMRVLIEGFSADGKLISEIKTINN